MRRPRSSSRSRCSPPARCGATSQQLGAVSPGTAHNAGSGALLTGTECTAVGFGGALVGWIVGSIAGGVAAAAAGAPVGAVLTESVLSPTGLLLGLATAVVAAAVIAIAVSLEPGRRGRLGPLDLAALGAVLAALAILLSGAVDADELASGGASAVTLLILPGLVAFAVAVAASRALPAVGRLAARHGRSGSARLAGVSLARSAGAAGVAAAFLALAVALAGLAEALPVDARDGRARPGGVRRPDRRRRSRGPQLARPCSPCRSTRAVRGDPRRRGGPSGRPADRERRPGRVGLRA